MNLDQIKSHNKFPFRNFAVNNEEFMLLELYWAELFKQIVGENEVGWVPMFPADRSDGNPIFSVINRNKKMHRALRVIQRFNYDRLLEVNIDPWGSVVNEDDAYVPFAPTMSRNALDIDGETSIEEVVISSDISPVCEKYFSGLVRVWCVMFAPSKQMSMSIGRYWDQVEARLAPPEPEREPESGPGPGPRRGP